VALRADPFTWQVWHASPLLLKEVSFHSALPWLTSAAVDLAGAPTPAGRTKSFAATFAPAQGLQGLQALAAQGLQGLQLFFAAHGLQGLQAFFAAHGLQGLQAFFAAHGLQGLQAFFAAHGLQGLQAFFAAHGLQGLQAFLTAQGLHGLHAAASIRVGFLTAGGLVAVAPAISTCAEDTATIPPRIAATRGLRLNCFGCGMLDISFLLVSDPFRALIMDPGSPRYGRYPWTKGRLRLVTGNLAKIFPARALLRPQSPAKSSL